jgi:hypothetical protein
MAELAMFLWLCLGVCAVVLVLTALSLFTDGGGSFEAGMLNILAVVCLLIVMPPIIGGLVVVYTTLNPYIVIPVSLFPLIAMVFFLAWKR